MADELFGLTAEQVARLKRVIDSVEASGIVGPTPSRPQPLQSARCFIGVLTSAAAATTALIGTPKVAELNIYSFSSTGIAATGFTEKCYNFAPQAATTDRFVVCERCAHTGLLIITTQYCT